MAAPGAKFRDVTCGECGRVFITRESRKLFCDPCGIKRRAKLKERGVLSRRRANEPARAEIADASAVGKSTLVDALTYRPDFAWTVMFSVPFAPEMSKNRRWANNGQSVVYLTRSVKQYQSAIIAATRLALHDRQVCQNKLWIRIFVQKPNNRFDAVNAVDTFCDAIKEAIGLDDRWFCLDGVDWEIKKKDPRIFVRLSQESEYHAMACSHCGSIAPAETFPKRSDLPLGRGRVCRSCLSTIRKYASLERKKLRALTDSAGRAA